MSIKGKHPARAAARNVVELSRTPAIRAGPVFAAAVGILLGVLIGYFRLFGELVDPVLQILRTIPITAWVPFAVIFLGIGLAEMQALFVCVDRDEIVRMTRLSCAIKWPLIPIRESRDALGATTRRSRAMAGDFYGDRVSLSAMGRSRLSAHLSRRVFVRANNQRATTRAGS